MTRELAVLLDEYVNQCRSSTSTPNRSLLGEAKAIITERLEVEGLSPELVHPGADLYRLMGDREACIDLLGRYLEQPLSVEEESWARWERTDFLAMERRYAEAVSSQKEYLAWARRTLPVDQLLWVMFDGSQALCWIEIGLEDEWLHIFEEIMASIVPSAENRLNRFYYLRTAGYLLINFGRDDGRLHGKFRADEALEIAARIRDLAEEEPSWERAVDMQVQSQVLELDVYVAQSNVEQVRHMGAAIATTLDDQFRQLSPEDRESVERLRILYDNAAATLYRAQQYDMAIPLFRRSIEMGSPSPHARMWLAASLWATSGDRSDVLHLLREAAQRWYSSRPPWDFVREMPEFANVVDDVDFEQATQIETSRAE